MGQVLRNRHLWIILAIMTCGAIVYYADQIPILQDVAIQSPIGFARYSTHRILSIIPVAYAAFIFRFRGGVVTTIFISLALLPRALIVSFQRPEAIAETAAFLFIGLLVSWLIDKERQVAYRLDDTQQELVDSLQTIKNQQQQLASLHAIATMVYQSLDLNQIADSALDKVLEATGAEVGWIYLRDEEADNLVLSAHHGLSSQFVTDARRVKLGENPDGRVVQTGKPIVMTEGLREFGVKISGRENIGAILVVPLRTRAGVQGSLGIAGDNRHDPMEKLEMLTALGNQIGITIGHARLHLNERVIAQRLRLSEERYRGLFENAGEAILVCSTAGRIISVNRACERLTGYTKEELLSTTIYELFSGISLEMVKRLFSEKLERVTVGETEELRLVRKDGAEAFIELKVSPLLRGAQIIGLQVIVRDVSEERRLRHNMDYYVKQITRAQEDERLRISRELHDDTAQILAGLSRGLDTIVSGKRKISKPVTEQLEKLHGMADSALEGVRRFSQDLRPPILDDLGLVPALEWLAADLEEQGSIVTKVDITGNQRRLSQEKELAVFRIAQEALNNVKRHSEALLVEMTIDFSDDALTLVISDNGKGFDMPSRTSDLVLYGRLGIIGMRERARLVGGTLVVQSVAEVGTTITLRMSG